MSMRFYLFKGPLTGGRAMNSTLHALLILTVHTVATIAKLITQTNMNSYIRQKRSPRIVQCNACSHTYSLTYEYSQCTLRCDTHLAAALCIASSVNNTTSKYVNKYVIACNSIEQCIMNEDEPGNLETCTIQGYHSLG